MRPDGGGNLHPADAGGAIAEEWFYVDFGAGAEKDRAGRNSTGGVYLAGERRELPVFGPGGYVWRPEEGEQVLVLKTGQAGEAPCVAGQACGQDWNLAAGEVLIYSGSASIRIGGGGIRLTGDVLVNGKPVLTGEG